MATLDPVSVRKSKLFIETSTAVFYLVPHLWQVQVGTSILSQITWNESIKYLCVGPTTQMLTIGLTLDICVSNHFDNTPYSNSPNVTLAATPIIPCPDRSPIHSLLGKGYPRSNQS